MDSPLEFEGKNVAKALEAASKALKIPKNRIEYTVLSHGSSGIFGLVGVKNARISVQPPRNQLKRRIERFIETTLDEGGSAPAESAEGAESLPPAEDVEPGEGVPPAGIDAVDAAAEDETPEESAPPAERNPESPVEGPAEKGPQEVEASGGGFSADDGRNAGEAALREMVDAISDGAQIRVTQKPHAVSFQIEGGNPALLIGKKGQTLDAIQFILEKIVNKSSGGRMRVQVDVEGYLEKRAEATRELALKSAEKACRTGKPSTVGILNLHDRRVVHATLKEDGRIRTQSLGSGPMRKVVVFPKKSSTAKS